MVALIIIAYILIGIIEMIPLYKQGKKKELALYSVLFSISFVISILLSVGVKIPSPAKPIEKAVEFIIGSK